MFHFLPHKKSFFLKICDAVIACDLLFSPPPNPKSWLLLCIKPCALCNTHTRYRLWQFSIVDAPSQAVAYNIAKMQSSRIDVALLPVYTFFVMEVWNGIRKKILVWNEIWNGRLLVWNGNVMDENCQYGIWKNHLPFHAMPCPVDNTSQIK